MKSAMEIDYISEDTWENTDALLSWIANRRIEIAEEVNRLQEENRRLIQTTILINGKYSVDEPTE